MQLNEYIRSIVSSYGTIHKLDYKGYRVLFLTKRDINSVAPTDAFLEQLQLILDHFSHHIKDTQKIILCMTRKPKLMEVHWTRNLSGLYHAGTVFLLRMDEWKRTLVHELCHVAGMQDESETEQAAMKILRNMFPNQMPDKNRQLHHVIRYLAARSPYTLRYFSGHLKSLTHASGCSCDFSQHFTYICKASASAEEGK